MIRQIFLDMDGVLCGFEKAAIELGVLDMKTRQLDWNTLFAAGARFWEELEWINEGKKLYDFLESFCKDHNISLCILSSVPNKAGETGKKNWIRTNTKINPMNVHIVQKAANKANFANEESILVDDFSKNVRAFIQAGGNAIKFKQNAEEVIEKIKEYVSGDGDNER